MSKTVSVNLTEHELDALVILTRAIGKEFDDEEHYRWMVLSYKLIKARLGEETEDL